MTNDRHERVRDIIELRALRWFVFKALARFGWWVCPEPQRTLLYQDMKFDPNWKSYLPTMEARHDQ